MSHAGDHAVPVVLLLVLLLLASSCLISTVFGEPVLGRKAGITTSVEEARVTNMTLFMSFRVILVIV